MAKPILGYWELRGRVEPIRYLLHHKKVDFEDKRYTIDAPGFKDWQNDKFNLGMEFPNLPYYIDGDLKLTQSIAIIRYLGHQHGLFAKTDEQQRRANVAEQQSVDFRQKLKSFVESDEYEKTGKKEFLKSVYPMLKQWEKFLGDRNFIVGDDLNYADFMVYEAFDLYRLYHETILDGYPSLSAYFDRMKNLPGLHKYLSSSTRKAWPIFPSSCKFGGSGDPPKHL